MKEIKYINGDIERIQDTESFLDREYGFLAKRIKDFRTKNKVTTRAMAVKMGCSAMKVSDIERCLYRPRRDELSKLIYILNER